MILEGHQPKEYRDSNLTTSCFWSKSCTPTLPYGISSLGQSSDRAIQSHRDSAASKTRKDRDRDHLLETQAKLEAQKPSREA